MNLWVPSLGMLPIQYLNDMFGVNSSLTADGRWELWLSNHLMSISPMVIGCMSKDRGWPVGPDIGSQGAKHKVLSHIDLCGQLVWEDCLGSSSSTGLSVLLCWSVWIPYSLVANVSLRQVANTLAVRGGLLWQQNIWPSVGRCPWGASSLVVFILVRGSSARLQRANVPQGWVCHVLDLQAVHLAEGEHLLRVMQGLKLSAWEGCSCTQLSEETESGGIVWKKNTIFLINSRLALVNVNLGTQLSKGYKITCFSGHDIMQDPSSSRMNPLKIKGLLTSDTQ